jgi:hypothetical protein
MQNRAGNKQWNMVEAPGVEPVAHDFENVNSDGSLRDSLHDRDGFDVAVPSASFPLIPARPAQSGQHPGQSTTRKRARQ